MLLTKNNLYLYYAAAAIIIIILNIIGLKLPNYIWPVYGLVGVLLAMFTNYNN